MRTIAPEPGDRRFMSAAWTALPYFDYVKQTYLAQCRSLLEWVESVDLPPKPKAKLRFCARRYLDAIAPTNFAATNPEVLQAAIESGGETLVLGMRNLARDIRLGRMSLTDEGAFEVGSNLATTPGAVIHENALAQIIQYAPRTLDVHERPLVIVPPCISKYYVLDLTPQSSFVRHCVEQGHTVFLISWRNVGVEQGGVTWDDYLTLGVQRALAIAREVTGSETANALGFCVGGVLLASALAVLHARGERPVASLTLLATMLDYEQSGDLGALIDEAYVAGRERALRDGGIVPASDVAMAFSSLRANEFIWHYYVNNYLLGRAPPPFDLLYWNGDQANLPGAMFTYYIRNLYLENNLARPGHLAMCGTPVDLGEIDVPAYVFGAREDHISPWKCTYATVGLLGGDRRFVLGASGHVAGVINPPARNKRNFWVDGELDPEPERWFATAKVQPGSWWTHWTAWIKAYAGRTTSAPAELGNRCYRVIEPAPGQYVKARA